MSSLLLGTTEWAGISHRSGEVHLVVDGYIDGVYRREEGGRHMG